jgi:hypothetical protein
VTYEEQLEAKLAHDEAVREALAELRALDQAREPVWKDEYDDPWGDAR